MNDDARPRGALAAAAWVGAAMAILTAVFRFCPGNALHGRSSCRLETG